MLFPLGQVVVTHEVDAYFKRHNITAALGVYLGRHAKGDWGDISPEDKALNDDAINLNNRLLSSYEVNHRDQTTKIWIITEADRSVTTILFPHEY